MGVRECMVAGRALSLQMVLAYVEGVSLTWKAVYVRGRVSYQLLSGDGVE